MDIVISGSSGLVGSLLVPALKSAGHRVIRLVRGAATGDSIAWNPKAGTIDAASLEGIDAVIHLAGAGIGDKRWTPAYKAELVNSRVQGTTTLATAIASLNRKPSVMLSASAVGVYGSRGDEVLTEQSPLASDFLADLCVQWEGATKAAQDADIRVAHLRSGIILSATGGALKKQLPLFKLGLGGRMGSGKQWQSWIDIDDEIAAMQHLLTSELSGPVNLTAPVPVTNAEFTRTLGTVLKRPTPFPIPTFGPKLLFGSELVDNLLLGGQNVVPSRLQADGYIFRYSTLDGSLRHLLAS